MLLPKSSRTPGRSSHEKVPALQHLRTDQRLDVPFDRLDCLGLPGGYLLVSIWQWIFRELQLIDDWLKYTLIIAGGPEIIAYYTIRIVGG